MGEACFGKMISLLDGCLANVKIVG